MHDVIDHHVKISCTFSFWAMCATLSSRVSTLLKNQLFSVHSLHTKRVVMLEGAFCQYKH